MGFYGVSPPKQDFAVKLLTAVVRVMREERAEREAGNWE
jgi:hypothetical protein